MNLTVFLFLNNFFFFFENMLRKLHYIFFGKKNLHLSYKILVSYQLRYRELTVEFFLVLLIICFLLM